MGTKGTRYAVGFKLEVAKMVVDQGMGISQVSRQMNVGIGAVRKWVTQYRIELGGGAGIGKPLTAEQQRIRELERENQKLKRDCEFLKKASAFFAQELKSDLR